MIIDYGKSIYCLNFIHCPISLLCPSPPCTVGKYGGSNGHYILNRDSKIPFLCSIFLPKIFTVLALAQAPTNKPLP